MSIHITVDGALVEAREGATLLEAALAAGVYVPALCAHPDLLPQADTPAVPAIYHGVRRIVHDAAAQGPPGCGLCVVDVEGEGQVAACHTRVRDGQVESTRGLQLESLLESGLLLGIHSVQRFQKLKLILRRRYVGGIRIRRTRVSL